MVFETSNMNRNDPLVNKFIGVWCTVPAAAGKLSHHVQYQGPKDTFQHIMWVKQCHKPSPFWWCIPPMVILGMVYDSFTHINHESSILGITRDPCQYRGHLLRSLCGCVRGARHREGATGAGMTSLKHPGVSSMGYPPKSSKVRLFSIEPHGLREIHVSRYIETSMQLQHGSVSVWGCDQCSQEKLQYMAWFQGSGMA